MADILRIWWRGMLQVKLRTIRVAASRLDEWIQCVRWILLMLILATFGRIIFLTVYGGEQSPWDLLSPLALVLSVLTVLLLADREIRRHEEDRRNDYLREFRKNLNYGLHVIGELSYRFHFAKSMVQGKSDHTLAIYLTNAESIKEFYKLLTDRDLYEHMDSHSIKCIQKMSGAVFGVAGWADQLQAQHDPSNRFSDVTKGGENKRLEILDEVISNLNEARSSIESMLEEKPIST